VQDAVAAEFDALWQEQAGELARLAGAMGVERTAVADVLQDVYLTAWRKRPANLPAEDQRKWLVRVTVNRCNLEHRRAARWRAAWQRLTHHTNGRVASEASQQADQTTERNEQREAVRRGLKQMEPKLRAILVLRYYADFNSKQIAEILGLADSTVRGHLRAAREQLAAQLGRAGYGHE
jgi:RNA polymerase sigma-70 factor (ECF subfamily)